METEISKKKRFSFGNILRPRFIKEWIALWKKVGFRGFVKEKGWKVVAAIILYYLIRDTFLYIILPILVARGILGC
jgi:hypothetical protein